MIEGKNVRKFLAALGLLLLITPQFACKGDTQQKQETQKMDTSQSNIRHSALAGSWYEADPARLRSVIEQYMRHAKATQGLGTVVGLVSPHAGHVYSGPVAAYAYRQVEGKHYDTVVVIAPNHVDSQLGFSSVLTSGAYETPLGSIPVDAEMAKAIADFNPSDNVRASTRGHLTGSNGRMEHSLEIQLPFLQYALGNFRLVPIVMGDQEAESCTELAKAIAAAAKGKSVLIVGSSDMSHFFPAAQAREFDGRVKKYVEAYDYDGLLSDSTVENSHVCGRGPIATAMMACKALGATKATVLHMANSGDITGDDKSVVGYLAAAITMPEGAGGTKAEAKKEPEVGVNLELSDDEKEILRNVVKQTLSSVVKTGQVPKFNNFSGKLGEKWGAFVTLNKDGQLRGCIGNIIGTRPLISTVAEMTEAAALHDPRFNSVQPSELKDITFEISVLTPIRTVKDVREIVIGRDGIIITRGYNRGLLLPQVATEYGWDLQTFLEQTCRKAGLPSNAWKENGTTIEAFSAEVFH